MVQKNGREKKNNIESNWDEHNKAKGNGNQRSAKQPCFGLDGVVVVVCVCVSGVDRTKGDRDGTHV